MKKNIKTEMIFEIAKNIKKQKGFVKNSKSLKFNIERVDIGILSDDVSKKIDREKGNYVCLNFDDLLYFDVSAKNYLCQKICDALKKLIKKNNINIKKVLVVGLGNEKYACDSLGAKVTQRVLVTKPYLEKGLFSSEKLNEVYAVSLGVYGTTGLDSSEVIESICKFILPDLVVVIDSMVSSSENTLAKSVQISDTKLIPGGGVGNSRKEISKDSVGAPVFAVGVPLVVNLNQICKTESDLIVTPKDVETKVCVLSKIIAKAINLTFSKITEKELYELTE